MDDLDPLTETRSARRIDVTARRALASDTTSTTNSEASTTDSNCVDSKQHPTKNSTQKDVRFWGIMAALCIASLLGGLETTIVTTSLPTIVHELDIGDDYVWITNSLFLTSAAVQPLFGQLANIFGRRWLALTIVGIYTLGSGICGTANSGTTLIVGRSIQGVGTGGLNMILDVILSDLVPLRERGTYIAISLMVLTIGTSMGPFVGGAIVDNTTWRWVFYINLPVGGLTFILLFIFLQVGYDKEMSLRQKLKRVDFVGNAILMASTTAVLYALTYGGSRYLWSSTSVLLPLVFGVAGLGLFVLFEHQEWASEPVIPLRLFKNRTAAVVFTNTFLSAMLLYWAIFYLSVYFQAVLVSTPTRSGVQMLPVVLVAVPGAAAAVIILTKFGRYKLLHGTGFAIVTIGLGLFSKLDQDSAMSEWVIYQIVTAIGTGMVLNTLLPAFQAAQPESDQATATASWAFVRSFGCIWGVTVPATIFNNRLEKSSDTISDVLVRLDLVGGQAYGRATHDFISQFQDPTRSQIITAFADALKYVWWVSAAFSGLAFLLVLLEKDTPLRTELQTAFGLEEIEDDGKRQVINR